jgi:REP element-mobilizing transposase RayT
VISNRPRRFDNVSYIGLQRYLLTTCVALRQRAFADHALATRIVEHLLENARQFDFVVPAYCVMPDHLHALLEATSDTSDFCAFVKRFKQTTGFEYCRRTRQRRLWQPGYHEHILRSDEVTEAVARYILENPIRAALSDHLGEYPFAGSAVYNREQLRDLWSGQT